MSGREVLGAVHVLVVFTLLAGVFVGVISWLVLHGF